MISFGVQLKKQQPEMKLEAEMPVRALVRNVHARMLLLVPFFMGYVWDVLKTGLSISSLLMLECNFIKM